MLVQSDLALESDIRNYSDSIEGIPTTRKAPTGLAASITNTKKVGKGQARNTNTSSEFDVNSSLIANLLRTAGTANKPSRPDQTLSNNSSYVGAESNAGDKDNSGDKNNNRAAPYNQTLKLGSLEEGREESLYVPYICSIQR